MQAARRGTLLCMPLLCSSGMLLRWLLPVASAGFFIARCPSPTAADSFTVGASTVGGGCSSPAATGFFTAGRFTGERYAPP
ncbi:hypothetical protein B296_00004028 [Ensete ventricosum]|uniref:Secreted protein n=1 Tax=Ensete ventricosum TaxID=4639 RepID=A0A426Z7Q0_ENSVE|nr:hypothetical protein B296_00004028 [Ensete ventricosum]